MPVREGSPPVGDQIAAFLDDLLLAGRSPATIRTYAFFVRKLDDVRSAGSLKLEEPRKRSSQIQINDVRSMNGSSLVDACRNLMRYYIPRLKSAQICYSALACFGRYQVDQGWAAESPMARIPFPRGRPPAPRSFLTASQVQAVYGACTSDRDRLMIRLLLTGLRISELCNAKRSELRGDKLTIRGKGGYTRSVVLDAETLGMLETCRSSKAQEADILSGGPSARPAARILPLSPNAVRVHLAKLGRLTGIPGITPHSFRRTFASSAMLAGMDTRHIRTLGGWHNEAVFAERYVHYVLEDAALDAARRTNLTGRLLEP